jgi:DNA-binding NtrC family response regulator/tetratricopeptide (TPR) repeat protein
MGAMTALADLLGDSPPVAAVRDRLLRVLGREGDGPRRLPPILIQGETGTGKGLLASAIHRASARAGGPFVDVNCAAIPDTLLESELFGFERGAFTDARQAKPGLFQAAGGGTIFLDEVGLLPVALQSKLLKVIEERTVRRLGSTKSEPLDVSIIAATSEDLDAAVADGRFRRDLYFRLAVMTVALPPLRARGGDVLRLADHFLARACGEYGLPLRELAGDARAALAAYAWPGNVRELANVLERAALLAESRAITAADLGLPAARGGLPAPGARAAAGDPAAPPAPAGDDPSTADERAAVMAALRETEWNISRAAARLGVPRNTLRYRMERLGVVPEDPSPARRRGGRPPAARRAARGEPAAPAAGQWESRRVTLLSARLVASRAQPLASEATAALERVVEKIRAFGGRVEELRATGVVAAFGLDPDERAAQQAAHAATAVQKVAARAQGGDAGRPGIRLALHTETLTLGRIGDTVQIDGDARRAARATLDNVLEWAEPGAIVVSSAAAVWLGRRFALAPIEAAAAVATPAWRLLGHAEAGQTRFVGRDRELALLVERFERARGGQGQVVLLAGEPGIGKSRLLAELRRRVGSAATWVEGHALGVGRSMPFHPVIDMLRRTFRIDDGDTEAAVVDKIERGVARLGADLAPTLPFLRALLSVDPGDPRVQAMDPKLRRAEILAATHGLLERGAQVRPHVLVLEDAHWMDAATEEWLAALADGVAAKRVLIVVTYRPGQAPALPDRTYHTRLALSTLSAADSLHIARAVLEVEDVPPELPALVARRAEGNPFFVEEIVRSLQETGAVRRAGERAELTRPLDEAEVPETIQEVIRARLERLPATARAVLEVAAVIGRDFPRRLLEALVDAPVEVDAALGVLKAVETIYEKALVPEVVYTFRHALTQEVAYATLSPARRRALHAATGRALEALHADRLAEHAELLAHHFSRAEDWERALAPLLRAADKAALAFAPREALALYDEALQAAVRHPGGLDVEAAMTVHQAKAALAFVVSDFEQSRAEGARLLDLARRAGDRPREATALAAMAWAATWSRDLERAVDDARQAIAVAEPAGAEAALGRSHFIIGWVRAVTGGLEEAEREIARALPRSRSARDAVHESLALTAAGMVRTWEADLAEAETLHAEALAIARQHHLLVPLLFSCFLRGIALASHGAYGEALAGYHEGLALAEKVGDEAIHHRLLNCVGWIHQELGDLAGALDLNTRSAEVGRRRKDPGTVPNAEINLGDVHLARGDLVLAGELYEGVERLARAPDTSEWMKFRYTIRLAASQGELALARGDLAAARAHADRCLELATRYRARKNLVKGWRLHGEIATAARAWDAAEQALLRARDLADAIGNPPQQWRTHAALARLHAARGRADAARAAAAGIEVLDRVAAGLTDPALRASLERLPLALELRTLTRR